MQVTVSKVEEPNPTIVHLDNILHIDDVNLIEQEMTNPSFKWSWNRVTAKNDGFPENLPIRDSGQMVAPALGGAESKYADMVVKALVDNAKMPIKEVVRAKANMLFPQPAGLPKDFHMPHTDKEIPWNKSCDHVTALYYVNDADGPTYFFNKKFGEDLSGMHIIDQMSPKKGRLVIFNSNQYHASSSPINSEKRIVINIVLKVGD